MGTTAAKLSYLIDRKKQIMDFIKANTVSANLSPSSLMWTSTAKYSTPTWDALINHMNSFFPIGFIEVLYAGYFYWNGSSITSNTYYYGSTGSVIGWSPTISRTGTGKYTVTFTSYPGKAYYEFYPYVMGSHKGTVFNDPAYATCKTSTHSTGSAITVKVSTSDDASCNDASFVLILFGCRY